MTLRAHFGFSVVFSLSTIATLSPFFPTSRRLKHRCSTLDFSKLLLLWQLHLLLLLLPGTRIQKPGESLSMEETGAEMARAIAPSFASSKLRVPAPIRRSRKGGWTSEEDATLTRVVKQFDGRNWKRIAEVFPGRTDIQCLHRWQKVLNPLLVKGRWTKQEDECIIKLVEKHGCKSWSVIATSLPGRIGKQCRERWYNHLNPAIKRDAWTLEEESTLIQCHQKYGNKWAEIAKLLPGRSENSVKNHWNCSLKKKLPSIQSSNVFNQQHEIIALNLKDRVKKVGRSEADISKRSALGLGAYFMAQNTGGKALRLKFLNDESVCSRLYNQTITSEDSGFLDGYLKSDPTSRNKLATAVDVSPKLLNHWIDTSLCLASASLLSLHDADACNSSHIDSSLSNRIGSDHRSYSDKDFNCNVAPETIFPEIETVGSIPYLPLQMTDAMVPTSNEESARIIGHKKQNWSPVKCSTPDLSPSIASRPTSPASFLKCAAKTFKNTPSILRKRKQKSCKQFIDFSQDD